MYKKLYIETKSKIYSKLRFESDEKKRNKFNATIRTKGEMIR